MVSDVTLEMRREIEPASATSLAELAFLNGLRLGEESSKDHKSKLGQFFTPEIIARQMASLPYSCYNLSEIKILDPGCGTAILAASVLDRILEIGKAKKVYVELYEIDSRLHGSITELMQKAKEVFSKNQIEFRYSLYNYDFILNNVPNSLLGLKSEKFDIAIMNPPYFKLNADSKHAKALSGMFKGQPNIYSQFLAIGASLLRAEGELVAITPRSFCNGLYFAGFRNYFLNEMKFRTIHIFDQRSGNFKKDDVLQENLIFHCIKTKIKPHTVLVSSSRSASSLDNTETRDVKYDEIVVAHGKSHIICIPSKKSKHGNVISKLREDFCSLGYQVSTGPVVLHRSREFVNNQPSSSTVPLLTTKEMTHFDISQSLSDASLHVKSCAASEACILPIRNYVMIKRFTSKEQKRRLYASIILEQKSGLKKISFENHVNYIFGHSMSAEEAIGLCVLLNSTVYDDYFRSISGSTQVNATDLKHLKLPDRTLIIEIGKRAKISSLSDNHISQLVEEVLG